MGCKPSQSTALASTNPYNRSPQVWYQNTCIEADPSGQSSSNSEGTKISTTSLMERHNLKIRLIQLSIHRCSPVLASTRASKSFCFSAMLRSTPSHEYAMLDKPLPEVPCRFLRDSIASVKGFCDIEQSRSRAFNSATKVTQSIPSQTFGYAALDGAGHKDSCVHESRVRASTTVTLSTSSHCNDSSGNSPTDYCGDKRTRMLIHVSLYISLIVGIAFVIAGIVVLLLSRVPGNSYSGLFLPGTTLISFIKLSLSVLVTIVTEATGYVHGTALKWALAREGRLDFNANIRLANASGGLLSANGWPANFLYAVTLIISYVCSSFILLPAIYDSAPSTVYVSFIPLVVLGVSFILHASLSLAAFYLTPIPTWSSNPCAVAEAVLAIGVIRRIDGYCLHPVSAHRNPNFSQSPAYPRHRQPSLWRGRLAARNVVRLIWTLVFLSFLWGGYALGSWAPHGYNWNPFAQNKNYGKHIHVGNQVTSESSSSATLMGVFLVALIQAIMTLGLHCCEVVVTSHTDELVWRKASGKGGARSQNPIYTFVTSWPAVLLFLFKVILHWLFGNAISGGFDNAPYYDYDWGAQLQTMPTIMVTVDMDAGQIICLSIATVPFVAFITFVATRCPCGSQPAAYGHIQTLVNVIDEWSPVMYWGHKKDGAVCHAGTSDQPLPKVYMGVPYAGEVDASRS